MLRKPWSTGPKSPKESRETMSFEKILFSRNHEFPENKNLVEPWILRKQEYRKTKGSLEPHPSVNIFSWKPHPCKTTYSQNNFSQNRLANPKAREATPRETTFSKKHRETTPRQTKGSWNHILVKQEAWSIATSATPRKTITLQHLLVESIMLCDSMTSRAPYGNESP